jgi:ABC-type transporter Mla subunit MlaD
MLLPRSMHRDYDRLARFLRRISLRFQLLATLESVLRLVAGFTLVILGSIFALEWGETFPYLSFSYSLAGLLSLIVLLSVGVWRIVSRPSTATVARGLEYHFPRLKDDVTNSLLLFREREVTRKGAGQISGGFIAAQIQKTADEVCSIRPQEVVNLKKAFRHLRLLIPLLSALAAVLAIDPSFLNRSLALITHPWAILPSRETSIFVEPAGSTVLRGTPVVIEAKTEGNVPQRLMLRIWPEGREEMRLPMEPEGEGRFSYRVPSAQTSFQYQAYHGPSASPVYPLRVVDPPDVGKIELTLIPPDYTGLPREVREEGHIEALKGTVVNLEARTTKAVSKARIILNQGNQLPLEVKEDRLRGTLLIFYPGAYSIRLQDELGFENPEPVQYQIRLIPDEYPEGEIMTPARDLEITGNEIIPLVYRAQDDFGVSAVRLSYRIGGRERSIKLKSPKNARSVGPEMFRWDLASLPLIGGDRVRYRLEVEDNDSVSGPKVSYSRSFYLSVKDERTDAAREGEEAQRIAEALLDLLGDHLEAGKDREGLARRMEEILKGVDRNLERLGNRVERFDLESLRRNLASLKARMPGEQGETVTQELERLALLAEDIAKKAGMNEVEALAREIQNRQRRLLESLQDLKGSLTDKNLEALLKELDKLESLIQSVMEALSRLASRLPDEFINSPELRGMQFQDLFQDLGKIRQRLKAGDFQGALEAAQRLLQSLAEMMAALGRAGARAGMDSLNRLQGEMARQSSELDKILAEQREILTQTEGIDREVRRKEEKVVDRKMKESLSRMKELLENLRGSLAPEQQDSVEALERLLQKESLERFSGLLRELEKDLGGKAGEDRVMGELKRTLKDLFPSPGELLTPDHKKKFPGLSARQDHLKERTRGLQEKLEMLAQLFPGMDTEILKALQGAAGSMGKAAARLGGEDAPGAIPPEQDAIRSLSKSQQGMQKMAQQMASQMQAARWGYNLVYDPRPGWYYGPWAPMPTLPQPEVKRPREGGYTGIDREEFDPPSKDAYRVPRIYREKVLEGLKEEAPAPYKKKVERYFKGLTE